MGINENIWLVSIDGIIGCLDIVILNSVVVDFCFYVFESEMKVILNYIVRYNLENKIK